MYTSILYVLDHCFYLPLNHLFLSTIVPEQLYCNEKVIFCYKQIDSTRIAGGFCVSGISIFRNTKNSEALNRLKPIIKTAGSPHSWIPAVLLYIFQSKTFQFVIQKL